jgi:hypothetical protein
VYYLKVWPLLLHCYGRLIALPANIIVAEKYSRVKHPSLFRQDVSDGGGKMFYNIDTWIMANQGLILGTYPLTILFRNLGKFLNDLVLLLSLPGLALPHSHLERGRPGGLIMDKVCITQPTTWSGFFKSTSGSLYDMQYSKSAYSSQDC